jgi:deoxyribodipyrimidine photo-lyase
VAHGRRFDSEGVYVRRWVPELARLPDAFLHRPFSAPRAALAYAGVRLGETYPLPLVDHDAARERALATHEGRRGT